ncbi:tenascin-R [Elysia marginata]|uniref:Tenascin-R n=1 Tax=Elysia marginata TaxID=1093978 RepID=A0AAV4JA95_9GAST|nr:tenascin-R [Elysia marginata]
MVLVQHLVLLENRLEDRMRAIEDKIENRMSLNEAKIENQVSKQLVSLQNRLEDRIESAENKIENRFADKLCKLENMLSAAKFGPADKQGHLVQAQAVSETVARHMNESFEIVKRHLEQLQSLNKTDLTSILGSADNNHLIHGNGTNPSDFPTISNLDNFKALLDGFKQLEQNTCNVSTDILSSVHDQVSLTNTLINSTLQPMSDLLMPKRCERGLVSFVVQTPFPYPIIRPNSESGLSVSYLCDETTDGGGWIVIQRRTSGQEEFYRDWATYKRGFGSLAGDFWIGNENLHILTSSGDYELRVELKYNGKSAFAHYDKFSVASERNNYALTLGKYAGTAGDALSEHQGMAFSTFDKDNDKSSTSCARAHLGGWWYRSCHQSNLNGKWGEKNYRGPRWSTFSGRDPTTFTEMKIRILPIS